MAISFHPPHMPHLPHLEVWDRHRTMILVGAAATALAISSVLIVQQVFDDPVTTATESAIAPAEAVTSPHGLSGSSFAAATSAVIVEPTKMAFAPVVAQPAVAATVSSSELGTGDTLMSQFGTDNPSFDSTATASVPCTPSSGCPFGVPSPSSSVSADTGEFLGVPALQEFGTSSTLTAPAPCTPASGCPFGIPEASATADTALPATSEFLSQYGTDNPELVRTSPAATAGANYR